jgi:acyl-CoA thioester hydrolase
LYRPVEWRDVDMTGHVTIAALASLVEDSAVRVSAAHEWPLARCADEGFAIVLRRHEMELGTPLTLDDEVEIATWASDRRRSSAIRHYFLRRVSDGGIVARFRSLYIWVDLTSGRPIRIPRDFLASFAPNFATEATE